MNPAELCLDASSRANAVPRRAIADIAAACPCAILNDNIQHIGQVAYPRGAIRGQGWF